MIRSSCFNPVKPPALAFTAVAIPEEPIIISTVLFGNGAFRRTGLALKLTFEAAASGKFCAPFCETPLISLIPNVVTVPIPTGKSTPLTCIASPSANLPFVCINFTKPLLVPVVAANPTAPLLFPTINDVTGISASVISVLFKIKSVLTWISYKCKSHSVASPSYAASFKLNPYTLAIPIFSASVITDDVEKRSMISPCFGHPFTKFTVIVLGALNGTVTLFIFSVSLGFSTSTIEVYGLSTWYPLIYALPGDSLITAKSSDGVFPWSVFWSSKKIPLLPSLSLRELCKEGINCFVV